MAAFLSLVIVLRLVHVTGYKVVPNEASGTQKPSICSPQLEPTPCETILEEVTCETTWSAACPGIDHPLGAAHNQETFGSRCAAECTTKVPLSDLDFKDPKLETARQHTKCFLDMIDKAEQAGDTKAVETLTTLMLGEADHDAAQVATLDELQTETMNSQILAAKEVAAQWAQEALEKDTATVMAATEITDEVIQAYKEALEQVAATCGEIEAETIATDVEALLKQAQLHKRKTEHEMDQIEHEEFKMDKKCRPETIDIDYFVNRLKVKYGSAACGSSLLQTAHQDVADRLSITLNRHAQHVLALHTHENQLGHHFLQQIKAATSGDLEHPAVGNFYERFVEATTGNLTSGQRARLERLDQDPHWKKVRSTARCDVPDTTARGRRITDYKQCVCDGVEPVLVCRMRHRHAAEAHHRDMKETVAAALAKGSSGLAQIKAEEEVAEEAEEEAAMEEFEGSEGALIDSSARGYHNYTGFSLGPCNKAPVQGKVCIGANCLIFPRPADLNTKDGLYEESKSAVGIFAWWRNLFGLQNYKKKRREVPCLSADMITCIGVKPADPLKLKFSLGASIKDCGQGLDGAIATFSVNLKLLLCLGIPGLSHLLQLINADCMDLAGVKYFPFIGRLTVGDVTNFGEYWVTGEARFKFNFNFVVHDLTKAVTEYCNVKHLSWGDWAWHWIYMASSKSHDEICRIFPKCPSCYVSTKEQECIDWFDDQRGAHKELKVVIDEMYHEAYDCWWDWCSYRYKWKNDATYNWNVR